MNFERGTAQLVITKNGRPRLVALNVPALDALRSLVPAPDGRFFRCRIELRYSFGKALKAASITADAFGEPLVFRLPGLSVALQVASFSSATTFAEGMPR